MDSVLRLQRCFLLQELLLGLGSLCLLLRSYNVIIIIIIIMMIMIMMIMIMMIMMQILAILTLQLIMIMIIIAMIMIIIMIIITFDPTGPTGHDLMETKQHELHPHGHDT